MSTPADQQAPARPILALIALLCSVICTVLESMAISVALPAISRDFDVSAATVTWVIGASQMMIVALLLPMASLGEVVGYRRTMLVSLGLFSAASLVCMFAPSFPAVVAARTLQAIGTAGAMSLGFAMLRSVFSDANLGTAIGVMAATVAIASSLGPALSGAIMAVAGWREVFGLLAIASLLALALGFFAWPRGAPSGRRYDLPGAILVAAMLSTILLVINGLANGWPTATLLVAASASILSLRAILSRSQRSEAPVFPLDLLMRPVFALSICASICAFAAQTLGFILLPFYLVFGAGMDELQMAATLSIWPAATAIVAPIVGRFSARIPAGPAGGVGLAILAVGFVLVASIGDGATATGIALRLAVCGIGFGVFQTPNNHLIMLSAPRERSGAASGSLSLARQFGRAIGTAIAAFALATGPDGSLDALVTAAAIAVLGAAASIGRSWAGRTTSR